MSSNPGDVNRQLELLSPDDPNVAGDELSDVGSFSRTRPDVEDDDDDDDLDSNPPPEDTVDEEAAQLNLGGSANQSNEISPKAVISGDGEVSIQESLASSPGPSSKQSTLRSFRRGSLLPFDRRFSGMLLTNPTSSSQNLSIAFRPSHSRQSSLASTIVPRNDEADTPQPPWEVVRWSKLKKISTQMFSEAGKRNFGKSTCMVIGASIVVGTSKGLALVFDYQQHHVATIGLGTKAIECGAITSLAISADHSTIATGHATGHIFTWEINRPAKPFLHILPLSESQLENRTADGHVSGSAVVHIGFLGTRHTAIVSADNKGMAFSHLATRGLGAIARVVKTLRVLGRYPDPGPIKDKPRKASSVLAFAALPLGNVEHPTDNLGLTALLTPYLLVIVSTTPIAETQFKSPRPKEIPPHSTLSGCLAWFPAVKLKRLDEQTGLEVSKAKLVYCWSNILTVLDIDAESQEEKDRPPNLRFKPRSRWRSQEPIVAVQWLSRSVLGVLTISQSLVILEDVTLRVTDSFDLIQKHIFHEDIFSSQLHPVIENLNEEDESMHGVIADAFYMSFRVYKGRIFLLGFNDISVGTLSNWADRLAALIEGGEYIEAIRLAESYYSGGADKITVGLPEEDDARHFLVRDRLLDILSASLRHMSNLGDRTEENEQSAENFIDDLAGAAFSACLAIGDTDYLFEEVFEIFQAMNSEAVFFQVLEPYILSGDITSVTTEVFKIFVIHYSSLHREADLESIICHLDTRMMDIDQLASICKGHHLYDGLIHVWNQAIGDYVTPLVELLRLASTIVDNEGVNGINHDVTLSAGKIFPYLAQILTGKTYPEGEEMEDWKSTQAKAAVYGFLLSPKPIIWPPGSKTLVKFKDSEDPDYPYLLLILEYDAPSFLSMLNEVFEDYYLNGPSKDSSSVTNGSNDVHSHPTRQMIVGILLDLLNDDKFEREDTIYLDMFIARNLPKFPQFIALPGNYLDRLLERLCEYPSDDLAEDCQLSVEYLLSHYHPSDLMKLLPMFRSAGFFRVLKSYYRTSNSYAQLLETYFEDVEEKYAVFDCIGDCLRPGANLSVKQIREVKAVILSHASQLASINTGRTAETLLQYSPELLEAVLNSLDAGSYARFTFLKNLLDTSGSTSPRSAQDDDLHHKFDEQYVQLMCSYEPFRVASYIDILKSGDLQLQKVLPAIESSGAIDAAVILLARDGLVKDAMARLQKHMKTLESGLIGLIRTVSESPDVGGTTEGIEDLLSDVQKYAKVGIWLCQGQTKLAEKDNAKSSSNNQNRKQKLNISEADLSLDEFLWLELVDSTVNLSKEVSAELTKAEMSETDGFQSLEFKINASLRGAVQDCFTSLLNATTRPALPTNSTLPATQPHPTFLIILQAFLARAASSSPTLSDLRAVLAEIFQAYAFEEKILSLANQFLDKDLFEYVEDAWTLRQQGWRPRGNVCESCRKRVFGPGVGAGVWESWQSHSDKREKDRQLKRSLSNLDVPGEAGRGKGKATQPKDDEDNHHLVPSNDEQNTESDSEQKTERARPLAVFACRHIWHVDCLEKEMEEESSGQVGGRELRCPAEH